VPTDENLETLTMWYSLGCGRDYADPADAWRAFLEDLKAFPDLKNRLQRAIDAHKGLNQTAFAKSQAKAEAVLAGMTPSAQTQDALRDISEKRKLQGIAQTPQEIEVEIGNLLWMYENAENTATSREKAAAIRKESKDKIEALLSESKAAGDMRFSDRMKVSGTWYEPWTWKGAYKTAITGSETGKSIREIIGEPAPPEQSGPVDFDIGNLPSGAEARRKDSDRRAKEASGVTNIFNGGYHHHDQNRVDPAGRPRAVDGQYAP
jgi:hypothetical protein